MHMGDVQMANPQVTVAEIFAKVNLSQFPCRLVAMLQ